MASRIALLAAKHCQARRYSAWSDVEAERGLVRGAGQEALYQEEVPQFPEGAFPLRIL